MPRKRLVIVIIYHHDAKNEQIAQSDYAIFFEPIKKVIRPISELQIEPTFCPEVKVLIDTLEQLTSDKEDTEDLYLHFSGHGSTKGIPNGEFGSTENVAKAFLKRGKAVYPIPESRAEDILKKYWTTMEPVDVEKIYGYEFRLEALNNKYKDTIDYITRNLEQRYDPPQQA